MMAIQSILLVALTSFILTIVSGVVFIKRLRKIQGPGQPIRADGPKRHISTKAGTPTMGGLIMIFSILISGYIFADVANHYFVLCCFTLVSFGALGLIDDYLKVRRQSSNGISAKVKLLTQIALSLFITIGIMQVQPDAIQYKVFIPKLFAVDLGVFFYLFAIIVIAGSSNAVNLTDGLDGLAIVPVILCALPFVIICYLTAVDTTQDVMIFLSALIGASLAFLWFNCHPARIFMGDVGSLSLGAVLGTVSIITKHELILAVIGAVFIAETASVMLQVASYKMRGKRIFLMSPLHHHFEKKGWSETTVVIRFWIVAVIFMLIGLMLI